MEKKEQIMKKKKYIMPDITIIPMDEEVKLLDHISGAGTDTAADDSGMKGQLSGPEVGDNNGQGGSGVNKEDFGDLKAGENLGQGLDNNAPAESKKNQMWDLWEY